VSFSTVRSGILPPISRRRFLIAGATSVVAAGTSGGCGFSLLSDEEAGFVRKGIAYFYPGFFEYSLGPWQPSLPPNPDLVQLWKQTIDWFADHGLNFVIPQLGPYGRDAVPIGPDRVRFGWGYHYVLNFEKFPEARCTTENARRFRSDAKPFQPDEIKRNQDIVRAITEYGKEKGVDVYQHHYNFLAPTVFVDAHPELTRLELLRPGNFLQDQLQCWDDRRLLYYDLCWNKPLYREFLTACFEEYFELFPASAGILITPGERARCVCIHCMGPRENAEAAKAARYSDSPEKRVTISNFVESFSGTLRGLGKDPLVRNWIAGVNAEWTACLPKGVPYATKYSVFDLFQGGPDPGIDPWLESGHTMWFMKEITGNENSGQALNTVPWIYDDIAKKSLAKGVRNIIGIINVEGGFQFRRYRVQGLHETLFANAVGRREGTGQEVAERYYREIFGSKGPEILRAAEMSSQVPFHMTRVIGSDYEGFCPETGYFLARLPGLGAGWPGILGEPGLDPPPWMALGVANFGEFVRYLEQNPWSDDFRSKVAAGRLDPILFLRENSRKAEEGLRILASLENEVPEEAREELRFLTISANVAWLMGVEHTELLEARLYYSGAVGKSGLPVRKRLAREAMAHYLRALEAVKARGPLLEEFDRMGVIDPQQAIENLYLDRSLHMRLNRELPALEKALARLLTDS
jgi:hypothetical protein